MQEKATNRPTTADQLKRDTRNGEKELSREGKKDLARAYHLCVHGVRWWHIKINIEDLATLSYPRNQPTGLPNCNLRISVSLGDIAVVSATNCSNKRYKYEMRASRIDRGAVYVVLPS